MDNMKNPLLRFDTLHYYELIVPHYLFNAQNYKITILKTYKVNSKVMGGIEIKNTKLVPNSLSFSVIF